MTTTPDIISTMVCGPTITDATKKEMMAIPDYAIAGKPIRRLLSVEIINTTAGSITKAGVNILHNGVPNHDYASLGANDVLLDDAVENLLCFGGAWDDTNLIWVKVEILAPMHKGVPATRL